MSGASASVIVLTLAQGQKGSIGTIQLVHTSAGWRIASLGGAVGG